MRFHIGPRNCAAPFRRGSLGNSLRMPRHFRTSTTSGRPGKSIVSYRRSGTFQSDERIVKVVLVAGRVALPERLLPVRTAPSRKEGVALLDAGVHQREMDSGGSGKALPVNLRPADHHEREIGARRQSRLLEVAYDGAIRGLEFR